MLPWGAVWSVDHALHLGVADAGFTGRIPLDATTKASGQISKVTDSGGAMTDFNITDW